MRNDLIRRYSLPFILAALALASCLPAADENLLRNGDFAEVSATGAPANWRVGASGQLVSVDRAERPEGSAQSLRVDIRTALEGRFGEVAQRVGTLAPNATYVLSGKLKSTADGIAFLEVKLYKNRQELKRIASARSTMEWQTVTRDFFTGEADEVEIVCRYTQTAPTVGKTAWFAQLSVAKAGAPWVKVNEAVATFHSLGLYVSHGGDVSPTSVCRVRYRQAGEAAWRRGLDLVHDPEGNEFRGSLFYLTPDAAYEVECELVEPGNDGGKVQASARATARTWSEETPIGEVRRLPAGASTEPLVISDQGKPDAWILYAPPEGQTSVIDAEWKAEQAIRFENAAYVILQNATVRGGSQDCIRVINSHHVRIRRCDISGWGDPGTRRQVPGEGLYVDKSGRRINYHVGVEVASGSSQVVVEDNFIHDPRGTANSWAYGHPAGPQGVILSRTGGNNVVRNNDIIGSEVHWWNDAIESISNSEVTGGPYRDTDIYGNVLAFSNDDGTELDGGQLNVRYWDNWIDKALCGVSCAPNRKGPSYVFRNLIAGLGEERDSAGSAFKMGGGVTWSTGISFILHNTIYGKGGGLRSVGYGDGPDRGGYVAFSRNNLFAGPGRSDVTNISQDPRNDFDYDLTSRGPGSLATGGEAHAVTEPPQLADVAHADYRLAAGSSGIDQGCVLPGINDGFVGKAPDMGAFERGADGEAIFPSRLSGMSALPLRMALTHQPGEPARGQVRLIVPPGAGKRWTAHANSPWLRCAPSSGEASAAAQSVEVTVAASEMELRLYRGAITFRTDAGLSRTVMVDVKVYAAKLVSLAFEAEAGRVQGGFQKIEDRTASAGAYLHTLEGAEVGSAAFSFDVPEAGVYYVAARCFVPGPDAGVHDSFLCSMDSAAARIWDLDQAGAGEDRWSWVLVNARDEEVPARFELPQGRHTLTISSRERLARLDCLVITSSPYAEPPESSR